MTIYKLSKYQDVKRNFVTLEIIRDTVCLKDIFLYKEREMERYHPMS